ncbi:hypothetical protein [Paenibacillus tyrfis]|nr:hypothetical protein [Paenibacillus tyrfis]MCP1306505.1 hypothetical protein [Paenibacillus tyrfis]
MESVSHDGDNLLPPEKEEKRYVRSMRKEDTVWPYGTEESQVVDFLPGTW